MKTMIEFLKKNGWQVSTVVLLLLFVGKGCTLNKIGRLDSKFSETEARLEKKIDSLNVAVSKFATEKQVRDQMEVTMLNYLIYEGDLDKGNTSLSDIKNKIESND
jgi:hypothetical protein